MKLSFLLPNDPILIQKALKVDKKDDVKTYIKHMRQIAYGEQTDQKKPVLVGLAAPQIGISKRIILVDIAANGKGTIGDLRTYLNPEIIERSQETADWYEGCFSTARVCGIVTRPTTIKIKALTQEGKVVEERHEGYTARIIQHEIDHLNGILFPSHITNAQNLHWVEADEFHAYRNQEAWRNWPKKCSWKKWEEIRGRNSLALV